MRFKVNRNVRSWYANSTSQKLLNRRRRRRWLLTSTLIIFSIAGLSLAGPGRWLLSKGIPGAGAAGQQTNISPQALAQIEALIKEKETRGGAQQKMDSQLIYEIKMWRGESIADGVPTLETDLTYNDEGKVILDLKATVSDALLNQLSAYGANIVNSVPGQNSVRIQVDVDQIEAIAALPDVTFIQPKRDGMTSRVVVPQTGPQQVVSQQVVDDRGPGFEGRAAKVQRLVSTALQEEPLANVGTGVGSKSSEGDVAHRA